MTSIRGLPEVHDSLKKESYTAKPNINEIIELKRTK